MTFATLHERWVHLRVIAADSRTTRDDLFRSLMVCAEPATGDELDTLVRLMDRVSEPAIDLEDLLVVLSWLAIGNVEGLGPDESRTRTARERNIKPRHVDRAIDALGFQVARAR